MVLVEELESFDEPEPKNFKQISVGLGGGDDFDIPDLFGDAPIPGAKPPPPPPRPEVDGEPDGYVRGRRVLPLLLLLLLQ